MFWCAVIYNNTKDPLALPEFVSIIFSIFRTVKQEIWLVMTYGQPLQHPWVLQSSCISLQLSSNYQMRESINPTPWFTSKLCCKYPEVILYSKELEKEIKLRFLIAYMITVAIYAAILWYIVKFTATFGWKVSWVWWYSCLFAMFFQYVIIDNLISMIHWITYYCSISLAQFWMKIRLMKQSKTEGV